MTLPQNIHQALDCPFCIRVFYSKGALKRHLNAEHWDEDLEELEDDKK